MPTANEAWMDALIRHQVGLMRLAPGITGQVNELLNASEADMVRAIRARYAKGMDARRLENLLTTVRAARSTAWKDVDQLWADAMEDVAQAEPAFLDSALNAVSPAVLNTTLPTANRMSAIAKATPFQGSVMSDWAQKVQDGDLSRIEQAIKVGMTQGDSVDGIVKRVVGTVQMKGTDGVTQITRNNADSLTRTAVNAIANQAKQEYYAENSDILDTEVFLATLDARTTLVCASNDNKQFPLGVGPIPPLHWRCRSLRLAIINGEVIGNRPMRNFTQKQLLREYAEQNGFKAPGKRDGLPQGHKTSFDTFARKRMRELTGTVPARTSYNEWLKGQHPSFQDDVLGKTRADMFRNGDLTLDKFVNANGDKLTLKQLQIRDQFQMDLATPSATAAKSANVMEEYAKLGKPDVRYDLIDGTTKNYGAPKALVEQVSGELKRLGWNDLFKGYGGASIEWHGGRIPGAATSNGRMAGKQGKMWITADRRTVKSKAGWSISENMETASERVTATAIHEFGHAVHLYEMPGSAAATKLTKKIDGIVGTRFNAADREFLTKYADANHKEYFAESFSAYHINPVMLNRQAPKAYAMVEEVLEARGLPKNGMSFGPVTKTPAPVPVPAATLPKAPAPAPKGAPKAPPQGDWAALKAPAGTPRVGPWGPIEDYSNPKASSPVPGAFFMNTAEGRALYVESLHTWAKAAPKSQKAWREGYVKGALSALV